MQTLRYTVCSAETESIPGIQPLVRDRRHSPPEQDHAHEEMGVVSERTG